MTHDDRPEAPGPDGPTPDDRDVDNIDAMASSDDGVLTDALARTRADLAAHAAATPPVPVGLLADIDRALAAERATPPTETPAETPARPLAATPTARDEARGSRSSRRPRWVAAAVAAALLAVALVAGVLVARSAGPDRPPAPIVAAPPVLTVGDGASGLREGFGRSDYGPLGDPARLAGCLAAHGVPPGVRPVGARQVVVDGAPGVLLVLPTGVAGRFQVLVVGPGCAAGAPLTVSDTVVGR